MYQSKKYLTEEEKYKMHEMRLGVENYIQATGGDEALLDFKISGLVRRIRNLYTAIFNPLLHKSEITWPRLAILLYLYLNADKNNEEINSTRLSLFQYCGKNTISSLVDGLERQGLLKRENDLNDRRSYHLKITENGRGLLKKIIPQQLKILDRLSSDLTKEEKEMLISLLTKLLESLHHNSVFLSENLEKNSLEI